MQRAFAAGDVARLAGVRAGVVAADAVDAEAAAAVGRYRWDRDRRSASCWSCTCPDPLQYCIELSQGVVALWSCSPTVMYVQRPFRHRLGARVAGRRATAVAAERRRCRLARALGAGGTRLTVALRAGRCRCPCRRRTAAEFSGSDTQVGGSSDAVPRTERAGPELADRVALHAGAVAGGVAADAVGAIAARALRERRARPGRAAPCTAGSHRTPDRPGRSRRASPAGTLLHVPAMPATLQDLHVPLHCAAVCVQQTPSTQLPDMQLDGRRRRAARADRPRRRVRQVLPELRRTVGRVFGDACRRTGTSSRACELNTIRCCSRASGLTPAGVVSLHASRLVSHSHESLTATLSR